MSISLAWVGLASRFLERSVHKPKWAVAMCGGCARKCVLSRSVRSLLSLCCTRRRYFRLGLEVRHQALQSLWMGWWCLWHFFPYKGDIIWLSDVHLCWDIYTGNILLLVFAWNKEERGWKRCRVNLRKRMDEIDRTHDRHKFRINTCSSLEFNHLELIIIAEGLL